MRQEGSLTIYTLEEWQEEAMRRFGEDGLKWKFVCPVCVHVASVADYLPYKAQGASPDSAAKECIGRYTGAKEFKNHGKGPCNYAGYGLFRLSPIRIEIPGIQDGMHCFAFADEDPRSATPPPSNPSEPV